MNKLEKLTVIATLFLPFTLLRLGLIGFGEIILLLLFIFRISNFKLRESHNYFFSKLWLYIIFISLLGFCYHVLLLDAKFEDFDKTVFDLSSYVIILIVCILLENLVFEKEINIYLILKFLVLYGGAIFSALYIMSLFTNSIFGLTLRYFNSFSPLSTNVHQTAMFIVPLPFLGLFVLQKEKNKTVKVYCLVLIILLSKMAVETGSFKAYLGLLLGWGGYLFLQTTHFLPAKYRTAFIVFIVLTVTCIVLLNNDLILSYSERLFKEEDTNDGRAVLYTQALDVGMSSPIVGLGPGAHLWGGTRFWDAHQTLLAVFLQMGFIGLCVFLIYMFKIYREIFKYPILFSAVVPIAVYALGGDILRKLPTWIVLILIYYYCKSDSRVRIINNYNNSNLN